MLRPFTPSRYALLTLVTAVGGLCWLPARSAPQEATRSNAVEPRHRIEVALDACMEKNPSTAGMLQCIDAAQKAWDAEMNALYKKLMAKLRPKGQADLKAAQRAWIAFRDKEYRAIAAVYAKTEGTMYLPMRSSSALRLTRERALQLGSLLNILEIGEP